MVSLRKLRSTELLRIFFKLVDGYSLTPCSENVVVIKIVQLYSQDSQNFERLWQ